MTEKPKLTPAQRATIRGDRQRRTQAYGTMHLPKVDHVAPVRVTKVKLAFLENNVPVRPHEPRGR